MALGCMRAAGIVLLMAAAAGPSVGQVPEVETHQHDPAKAKTEFEAAQKQEKEIIAELVLLQAQYQQPGSDKKAETAKFADVQTRIPAVKDRLETAAFAMALSDPKSASARKICGMVIAAKLKMDDPVQALKMSEILGKAGAASGEVDMMAAAAAMVLSRLDEAANWLQKAEENGVQKPKVAELQAALEDERSKVDAEMVKRKADATADDRPRVKITTSQGDLVVELFEEEAPNTVANFISLVEKGFYDGTPFHRVIGGFMAQGGDPTGTGTGGPGYAIECECDLPNARKHFLGTLSMAHAGPNTGGSQFFLTFRPTEHLDEKHTVFGRVIEGFEVLPKITRTEGEMAGPDRDKIVKATVLRKRDHAYEPKTLPNPRK